ncbi:hypothetical protein [Streptomyces lasalocidi]|uniref:Integral membrane protein n=1 Tax=Streptomyces lasalocidi TaxID=324833 RepID=A0A4U5WI70_STRLS|nr:hypothetical protein [Streptomyces lasalocidi]TKT01674.1 hypothetical protein E4U91_17295 [Streptomyces lasalocidi]
MSVPHQSPARAGDGLRLLRAAVFAAVCVVLAAAGHTLASCATVPLWTLGAGFLGVLAVVAPLAGRARTLPGIAVVLTLGQTVLHTLFGLGRHGTRAVTATADDAVVRQAARILCGSAAAPLSPAQAQRILADARILDGGSSAAGGSGGAMSGMSGMDHSGDALTAGASSASLLPSLPMLLGHVLAAVAAGWLLRHGDLALLRLLALSAHGVAEGALVRSLRGALALVRALLAGLPGAPGPRVARPAFTTPVPVPHGVLLQHSVIRRGPPAASALLLAA